MHWKLHLADVAGISAEGEMHPAESCTSVVVFARIREFAEKLGFGLALERILAQWLAAAVSGVHEVNPRGPCCPS
jgi:hypothetical protein